MFKLGFCCKFIESDAHIKAIPKTAKCKRYNVSTTTIRHLDTLTEQQAEQKLINLAKDNIQAIYLLVDLVSKQPTHFRMLRLPSEILPCYTHENYSWVYQTPKVQNFLSEELSKVGVLARETQVRLSFHPGQFCVLGSDKDYVIRNSIEEFEYHASLAKLMGYGKEFQDFKCNIHIAGRAGVRGFRDVFSTLSKEAKNIITVENEEMSHNLEEVLKVQDLCPIVLDIHHHWVKDSEFLDAKDSRVQEVINSWRGKRPTMHYSQSKEELFPNTEEFPSKDNKTKSSLRAHSNYYHNKQLNKHVIPFLESFDIMLEAKAKNLARDRFYEEIRCYI